jgi:integrase
VPTLKQFAQTFLDNVGLGRKQEPKDSTKGFYADCFKLDAPARAFGVGQDERQPAGDRRFIRTAKVGPARKNAYLRTLRRAMHVAMELGLISTVPRFAMEQGEVERDFVLSPAQESTYLGFAPQPLKDAATLMLGTGLCVGEVCGLEWRDVHLEPVNGARFGYLHVRAGKTRNRKRNVPLNSSVRTVLEARARDARTPWVFNDSLLRNSYEPGTGRLSESTLQHQHMKLRQGPQASGCLRPPRPAPHVPHPARSLRSRRFLDQADSRAQLGHDLREIQPPDA